MSIFKSPSVEGPGVLKSQIEKRGFIIFFERFWRSYGNLLSSSLKSLLLNLLFFTSGLGEVGIARIARAAVRDRHAFPSDYNDSIKRNWKQALAMGIINNILLGVAAFSTYFIYNGTKDTLNFIMAAVSIASLIIIIFIRFYTPAILIMFNVSMAQLYKDAIVLAFAGFLRNFAILFIHLATYALVISPMFVNLYVGFGVSICLYLVIVPPMRAYSTQYHIFPVMYKYLIKPFMENHPGEGEKTLRELGLIEDNTESVMNDETE